MDRTTPDEKCTTRQAASCEADDSGAVRCLCGGLIARRVTGGVELECRRCKRTIVVVLASAEEACVGD